MTSLNYTAIITNHSKQSPCPDDGAPIFMGKNNHSLYVASLGSRTRFRAVKLNLVDRLDFGNIIGCCNGLVLCQLKWVIREPLVPELVLVNPSTLRYKRVPILLASDPSQKGLRNHEAIGFGYDHITDDYKVVVVGFNDKYQAETFIYSSRADSWRKFTGHTPGIMSGFCYFKGVLLNNHLLHWYFPWSLRQVVDCFDITTEKWSVIPLPERSGNSVRVTDMGVQNGLLSISSDKFTSYVWVMKEYGVKDSWAEVLNKTEKLGVGCQNWKIAPIANHAQGDGEEIWLMKLECRTTSSTIKWYAIREGKEGLFAPFVRFRSSTLVDWCYTGFNRTLVTLEGM